MREGCHSPEAVIDRVHLLAVGNRNVEAVDAINGVLQGVLGKLGGGEHAAVKAR